MNVKEVIQIIQYSGFVSAQIINVVLLYLLFFKANKKLGKYRVLMIVFSIFGMMYSLIEVLTFPVMFCKGRSLSICSDGPFTLKKSIGFPLIAVYCASFGMCISLLALHFYYRYIAVCRPDKLFYFDGNRILYCLSPCFLIFFVWTLNVFLFMKPDQEKEDYYYDVLMDGYGIDSHKVSFLSMMYKSPDTDTTPAHWNLFQLFGLAICCVIMTSCFSIIIFCGFKSWKQMKNCTTQMSKKTRELNRQLFLTLGIQTLLPLITMYLPGGCFILLPAFGIELGANANQTGAFIGVYPALDPFIAIFLIKDFRNYVFCKSLKLSRISTATENTKKSQSNMNAL